jgi:2-polyprenyl-3-methyl-5-hydroxy-6-metoxy-1,4-benzoquinol methylase
MKPRNIRLRIRSKFPSNLLEDTTGIVRQPDLFPFATYLGRRYRCSRMIEVGCGRGEKLAPLHPEFHIVGIDCENDIRYCKEHYNFGEWIESDVKKNGTVALDRSSLDNSIVICSDVAERFANPVTLLRTLRSWLDYAHVVILTSERDFSHAIASSPTTKADYSRELNPQEMERLLKDEGFNADFVGLTMNNSRDLEKKTTIALLENNHRPKISEAPADFCVVAFMAVYNEEDIIVPSIKHLIGEGVRVYVIDNWSNDKTFELAKQLRDRGVIGIERFPREGPSKYFKLKRLLMRVEELTKEIDADWFIHQDVDEFRMSPWPHVSLRDGIHAVDRAGYNSIDHTIIIFPPIHNDPAHHPDFETDFKYFEFGKNPGHFLQIKAWKNLGRSVSLAESGGHDVQFEGRRVYPYKFLLKHYPIRSQVHGERKIFLERKPRWDPEEKSTGWHVQYDEIKKDHIFLRSPPEVELFDEARFNRVYLVERLSGIGVVH